MKRYRGSAWFVGAWLAVSSVAAAACISDSDGDGVCDNVDVCPNTIPGAEVDADGCPALIPADFDRDGDVDSADLAVVVECSSGPAVPADALPGCEVTDFDEDADVDSVDFAVFQRCFSGTDHPVRPDCERVSAHITNSTLRLVGTGANETLALRLQPGAPLILQIDIGNDGVVDFAFVRTQFDRIIVDGLGGHDVVWIDEQNGAFTDAEVTTINGGSGEDILLGGSGGETYDGGPDNDQVYMGPGNDRFIWNPGDDSDLIEGAGEIDTVEVNGSDDAESFTVTANGTRVRFDRLGPAPFFLDIGASENLVLNANGGNDTFTCTGNLAALIQITADGGAGEDTLLGSNGPDLLVGGDDNDFIDGNQGADVVILGAGDDTFQWDPGDGNDTIEGQDGADVVVFNGSGANEIFGFSANGQRLRFVRDVGNITLDADDVERFDLRALGGTDMITVNDLSGIDIAEVNVDLAGTLGGNTGDAQADAVTVNGTAGPDTFSFSADAGAVVADGLGARVRVKGYETADRLVVNGVGGDLVNVNGSDGADTMTVVLNGTVARVDATGFSAAVEAGGALTLAVNGLGGPDMISCAGNLASLGSNFLRIDGGAGNDILLGSNGADVLIGGNDNDFIDGNQGIDVVLLGAGDDVFQWDPGDGSDTIEGQAGSDVLLFNGSGASEIFDFSANGARLRLTRNVGSIVMDIDGVEEVDLQALGGADAVIVNSLAGTAVAQVSIDLAGVLGGNTGDTQPDTITVNGTAVADTINVAANAGAVEVSGLAAQVRVTNTESVLDTLVVNGLGGADTITAGPGVAALIMLTINQ